MKSGLLKYKGLYGDNNEVVLNEFLHHELLEIRSKIYNWEIREHLHIDLYQMFLIESGTGVVISEGIHRAIVSPCVVLIPSNTLHGFHFDPSVVGEVITFSDTNLDIMFKNHSKLWFEISRFQVLSFQDLQFAFDRIKRYFKQILQEMIENLPEKKSAMQGLFLLIFLEIYRRCIEIKEVLPASEHRNLEYFRAFQRCIKKTISQSWSVEEYARELNITSVHLNRLCRALVQKSALEIIHEHLLLEAKIYLLTSNYTVSEIAYLLNFSEPAYFTKFFKKHTGITPTEFRKR